MCKVKRRVHGRRRFALAIAGCHYLRANVTAAAHHLKRGSAPPPFTSTLPIRGKVTP
jgi:hypothetical protein